MMARAYGDDLRLRVLEAAAGGASARSAAARFGVGISTAIVWIRRARQDGERCARRQGKPRGSRLDAHAAFIVAMIEAAKDITLDEMVLRLKAECAVEIGRSGLSSWLRARGWTFKKSPRMRWSRSGRIS
jgi:transposase